MDVKQADVSAPAPRVPTMAGLSEQDRAILDLEAKWFRHAGSKEQAIFELGMPATRYYQRLNRLIDSPDAVRHYPTTVNRLRRLRERRAG
jgi:hypothetical protein